MFSRFLLWSSASAWSTSTTLMSFSSSSSSSHDHHFCLSQFRSRRKVISINRVKWSGVSVTGCSRSLFIILFGLNWLKLNARKWRYIHSLDRTAAASICSNRLEATKNAAGRWLVFFSLIFDNELIRWLFSDVFLILCDERVPVRPYTFRVFDRVICYTK